nr:hypothetical protein [Tanacetum cinerariifolium]
MLSQCSFEDHTGLGSFPPLPSQINTSAGNTPGKSSYADVVGNPSGKKLNIRTMFTPRGEGRVAYPIVANYVRNTWGKYGPVRSMFSSSTGLFFFQFSSVDGLDFMLENGPWFIRNNPLILKRCHLDENLLKEDVSIVSVSVKLHGVPVTAFSEDGLSAIATKLGAGEKKNVMKPNQPSRGVAVGPTMSFKHQKEYRPVKKPAANNEGNKNNYVESTNEVSKSNSFDVLNLADNGVEMGTNGGSTHLANQEANSCRSSFLNAELSSPSTTPIMEKINKIKKLIMDGKAILVDNEGKPFRKVDDDSEDEVASVDNDMTNFLAKNDGYGTLSLLELWKDSHELDGYEYDPYDDDLYEREEIPEMLQVFCDRLDIKDSHELDDYEYDPYDDDLYVDEEIPEILQAFCDRLDIKAYP